MVLTWWWLQLLVNKQGWTLQVRTDLYHTHICHVLFMCSCLYYVFKFCKSMLNCRGAWFLLDTCMWRWGNEQDTQGKVCWTLRNSDIGKCKVSSFSQPFFDLVKCHDIILVLFLFLIFWDWVNDALKLSTWTHLALPWMKHYLWILGITLSSFNTNLLIHTCVISHRVKLSFLWDFLVLNLGPVWIDLFELISCCSHHHVRTISRLWYESNDLLSCC